MSAFFLFLDFVKCIKIYEIRQGRPQKIFPQNTKHKRIKNCLNQAMD